ncbi:restriction endonuclease subunit S [Leeuwenhoekiella sp. NPDC079379]|uniref:restriction endonuclease subunit S n=1 Tax=Leeuwenhoekiella sp. NPDC079379 TaxID=3364122 RepID=UPI0037C5C4A5
MKNKLPENWTEARISQIIPKNGLFKDGDWVETKDQDPNGNVRLIQLADIGELEFRNKSSRFLTEESAKKLNCSFLNRGDILIARMPDPIGRACVFPLEGKYATVVDVAIIRPKNSINEKFLCFQINNPEIRRRINALSSGSTRKRISRRNLDTIKFKIPPRAEQDRIVAKLDGLFEQLERINKSLSNLESMKERFLYSCLVDRKQQSFYKRLTIGKFLEEGTERIGENWNKCRLIGVSAKEGITDLRVGQKKSFEKYKVVRKGDFIYNTMRVNIGSIAIYNEDAPAITSPDYVVFRTNKKLSSDLLLGFLKSDQGLLEIGANTKGSVRARLYFKSLSNIRMPYGEEVQQLAQNFLGTYNSTLMDLNKLFDSKIPELRQSILNKAFKGELVPQLESDGDARELLKEIEGLN